MKKFILATLLFISGLSLLNAQGQGGPQLPSQIENSAQPHEAPPADVAEQPGEQPQPGFVWINGYYCWEGGRYIWVPGHWIRPPRPNARWVAPHWVKKHNFWKLEEGKWQ